ncbi:MAG: peptidase C39 family protein [Fimbriimonadaceae bacterium]|nr:peptidase C39 family protein [Fimbriimonadaceae bacterium]
MLTALLTALALNGNGFPQSEGLLLVPARSTQTLYFKEFKTRDYSPDRLSIELEDVALVQWNNIVLSWNVERDTDATIKFEVRPVFWDQRGPYFTLGTWSLKGVRESTNGQSNTFGKVQTDILVLNEAVRKIDIRITSDRPLLAANGHPLIKSLFVSAVDSRTPTPVPQTSEEFISRYMSPESSKPGTALRKGDPIFITSAGPMTFEVTFREAWGKLLLVPQRCQGDYPNGSAICSPTATSMILAYWANKLNRPELDEGVERVCAAVNDPNWPGTGNWPFNTAYAGSFPGMRGLVARLESSATLEQLIAKGIPVACSVSYDLLKGKDKQGKKDGHLVVCVGFTKNGDPIFNDPGKRIVRQTYDRWAFERAWATSNRTTYLIFPESHDSVIRLISNRYSGP